MPKITAPPRPKRRSYRRGNLKETILVTSLDIIRKLGVEGLSIREAAKLAGVTHQAPYRHFSNKEALVAALAQQGFEQLFEEMRRGYEKESDALARLQRLAEIYFVWAAGHPAHFRLLFSRHTPDFERSEGLAKAADAVLRLILDSVVLGQASGLIVEPDTRALARQFWAAVHGATQLFLDGQFRPLKQDVAAGRTMIRRLIRTFIFGVHAPPLGA